MDGRGRVEPGTAVASQEALNRAVERLRRLCLADAEVAEVARRDLMPA